MEDPSSRLSYLQKNSWRQSQVFSYVNHQLIECKFLVEFAAGSPRSLPSKTYYLIMMTELIFIIRVHLYFKYHLSQLLRSRPMQHLPDMETRLIFMIELAIRFMNGQGNHKFTFPHLHCQRKLQCLHSLLVLFLWH